MLQLAFLLEAAFSSGSASKHSPKKNYKPWHITSQVHLKKKKLFNWESK